MGLKETVQKRKGLLWVAGAGAAVVWLFTQGGSSGSNLPVPGLTASNSAPTQPGGGEAAFDYEAPAEEQPQVVEADGLQIQTAGALVLLNPGSASAGTPISISGTGFTPGGRVNLLVKRGEQDRGKELPFVNADKNGNITGSTFEIPEDWVGGKYTLIAKSADGKHEAKATGTVTPKVPEVKMAEQVGKPGDVLEFSARSFKSGETVHVFLDSMNTDPVQTFTVGSGGNLDQGHLRVPFGAAGQHSLIFYGETGQAPVAIPFTLLQLYPSGGVSAYATRADTAILLSGTGFGPKEPVRIHVNSVETPPIAVVQADSEGNFKNAARFAIPFQLTGKQNLIFVGEGSQATSVISIEVQPYMPSAEASTYGGRPGTTVTFYGSGFARNEIVHVFAGATKDSPGKEVACGRADPKGNLAGQGSYTIPANAQPGTLSFTLVGDRSKGKAIAEMEIMPGPVPNAQAPSGTAEPFVCPLADDPSTISVADAPLAEPPKEEKPGNSNAKKEEKNQNQGGKP